MKFVKVGGLVFDVAKVRGVRRFRQIPMHTSDATSIDVDGTTWTYGPGEEADRLWAYFVGLADEANAGGAYR